MSSEQSQQHQNALDKARQFQQEVVAIAQQQPKDAFYLTLFRLAADQIEKDVDSFCDRAAMAFEEIEAYGHEPTLDDDWLDELTGENDTFYFSTDSLTSELPPLPGKKRGRKPKSPTEQEVVMAVQNAVQQAEDALAVSHMEDPGDWVMRIQNALQGNHGQASFAHLLALTRLSPGALFLGLLLGHEKWRMKQHEFYGEVMVGLRK